MPLLTLHQNLLDELKDMIMFLKILRKVNRNSLTNDTVIGLKTDKDFKITIINIFKKIGKN